MGAISLIIRLCLLAAALFSCTYSHANTGYYWYVPGVATRYADPQAACLSKVSASLYDKWAYTSTSVTDQAYCYSYSTAAHTGTSTAGLLVKKSTETCSGTTPYWIQSTLSCAASTACAFNQTYNTSTGVCDVNTCVAGIKLSNNSGLAGSYCVAGCAYEGSISVSSKGKNTYSLENTGVACTTESKPPASTTDSTATPKCGSGYCSASGTVNGVAYEKCVVCNTVTTSTDKTESSTTTNKDATGTTTSTSTGDTVTKSSSATCTAGNCTITVTQTTTKADGTSSTTTTSGTQSQSDYCSENPSSSACSDSAWSDSGCSAAPTCSGDAVQCAQANLSWKSYCATQPDTSNAAYQKGVTAISGGGFTDGDPTSGGTVDVGTFDQSERYSGSCPTDPVFTVWGKTVTVPLSKGCTYLQALGYAAMAVCLMAGVRIALGD
jgi:hypothetical protein